MRTTANKQKIRPWTPTCTLEKEKAVSYMENGLFGSGDWTRTSDLWVMSPTSYQLLHPALFWCRKVKTSFWPIQACQSYFRYRKGIQPTRLRVAD